MTLDSFSTKQLEDEIQKRQKQEADKIPPIVQPDFRPLIKVCQEYIDDLANNGYVDEDMKEYIFEAAMEAIFGKVVWKYIKEKTE